MLMLIPVIGLGLSERKEKLQGEEKGKIKTFYLKMQTLFSLK